MFRSGDIVWLVTTHTEMEWSGGWSSIVRPAVFLRMEDGLCVVRYTFYDGSTQENSYPPRDLWHRRGRHVLTEAER